MAPLLHRAYPRLWALAIIAAAGCSEPPADVSGHRPTGEIIAARLLDELEGARVTLGPVRPGAETDELELLALDGGRAADPVWVALDGDGRQARSEALGGAVRLLESACTVVPAGGEQSLVLRAAMVAEEPEEGQEQAPIAGVPIAVELDERPPSNGVGCRLEYLSRHGLMPRPAEASAPPEGRAMPSYEVGFTTVSQTRAVAVVLATGLRFSLGLGANIAQVEGSTARVESVHLARRDLQGMSLDEVRDRYPPDPLVPADPEGLRVQPDLGREIRDAVVAPAGTSICWSRRVEPGSSLRVALGVAWTASSTPARPVQFVARAGEEQLFEAVRTPGEAGWIQRERPLPEGEQEICLETRAEGDRPGVEWSMWGTPEIVRSASGADERPRTVVLVSIDTLRADRLGTYGYGAPTSPIIDGLGEEGMVHEEHVAQTGWTLPSHVSMLTGLTPEAHGISGQMDRILELLDAGFDPSLPTLAQAMRQGGYATFGIVSGPYLDPAFGFARGFDSYDARTISSHLHCHRDLTAEPVTTLARRVVGAAGRRPLFLFLHYWDVHYDYIPPPRDLAAVHPRRAAQPIDYGVARHPYTRHVDPSLLRLVAAAGLDRGPLEFYRRIRQLAPRFPRVRALMQLLGDLYDGEIHTVDRRLGELMAELERRGRGDAVVVITSDHGESFMEHGTLGHGVDNIHREGLVVPLVIRAPGRVSPGRAREPSSTVDISATVLALAGLDNLEGAQGLDVASSEAAGRLAVGHDGSFQRVQATLGRQRLLVWGRFGPDELFDLDEDPLEQSDVGDRHGERRREIRERLARYLLTHGRGVHVAVVGDEEPGGQEVVVQTDRPLVPAFAYGPPHSASAALEDEGRRIRLRASPAAGEIVAVTLLLPDDAPVSATVTVGGEPPPTESVLTGRARPITSERADDSWALEGGTLPEGLGERPGTVYLFRTSAGTRRQALAPAEETLEQLRSLGYIR